MVDRVDTLLKVGLGARGRADLVLARYTCKALQRMSGSVKKVKGQKAYIVGEISLLTAILRFVGGQKCAPQYGSSHLQEAASNGRTIYSFERMVRLSSAAN